MPSTQLRQNGSERQALNNTLALANTAINDQRENELIVSPHLLHAGSFGSCSLGAGGALLRMSLQSFLAKSLVD
jgi:hypothetical protein